MTPPGLSAAVEAAVADAVRAGGPVPDRLPAVRLERCRDPRQGDYTTTVALRLARLVDVPARELGARLAAALARQPTVRDARVAGPGFVNVSVRRRDPVEVLTAVLRHVAGRGRPTGHLRSATVPHDDPDLRARRRVWVRAAVRGLQDAAGLPAERRLPAPADVGAVHVVARDRASLADADPANLRLALLRHPVTAPVTLDAAALARDAVVEPGYLVRYAAARCRSLLRNAADLGWVAGAHAGPTTPDALAAPAAAGLVAALSAYPEVLSAAAQAARPERLVRHLEDTADAALAMAASSQVLPRGDEETDDRHRALLLAVRTSSAVLDDGLALLAVPSPARL